MNFLFGSIFHLPRWHIKRLHWGCICFAWWGCSLQFFDATLFGWWLVSGGAACCLLQLVYFIVSQKGRQAILIPHSLHVFPDSFHFTFYWYTSSLYEVWPNWTCSIDIILKYLKYNQWLNTTAKYLLNVQSMNEEV